MMSQSKKRICIVTSTRAEYGLLNPLIEKVANDEKLDLILIVTGMHLSPEFGLTYQEIAKDGFKIDKKIEILLSTDSRVGSAKSMGLAILSFSEVFDELKPDIIIVLGDRFEIFAVAATATMLNIPIGHISGGESTIGAVDEAFRHSITKMAQLHFVSTNEYRNRVIQLGEQPDAVYNVGALGIDTIKKLNLLDKEKFEQSIDFPLSEINFLITYHPETLNIEESLIDFNNLLSALQEFKEATLIFTLPNSDPGGRKIIQRIEEFIAQDPKKRVAYKSLGQLRYLSAIKNVDIVIGNSSSGILEVPYFHKPTINIGDRQKGRLMGKSILNCAPKKEVIIDAINKAVSKDYLEDIKTTSNPYGNGTAAIQIVKILKNRELSNLLKKQFYDIPFILKSE